LASGECTAVKAKYFKVSDVGPTVLFLVQSLWFYLIEKTVTNKLYEICEFWIAHTHVLFKSFRIMTL